MEQVSIISPEDDAVSISPSYDYVAGWGTLKFHDTVNQVCSDVSYSPFF